jgi:hypothetical protein
MITTWAAQDIDILAADNFNCGSPSIFGYRRKDTTSKSDRVQVSIFRADDGPGGTVF